MYAKLAIISFSTAFFPLVFFASVTNVRPKCHD